jgi:hypothetical protein
MILTTPVRSRQRLEGTERSSGLVPYNAGTFPAAVISEIARAIMYGDEKAKELMSEFEAMRRRVQELEQAQR